MKEASGELSMTAVAVVAIAAVGVIFTTVVWPNLKGALANGSRCASAYNCGKCENKNMSCTGYYDKDGNAQTIEAGFTCKCENN